MTTTMKWARGLSETQLRVGALETILTEKGMSSRPPSTPSSEPLRDQDRPAPNGARVVAKAWTDPAFKQAFFEDASKAVATLGHVSRVGDHLVEGAVGSGRGSDDQDLDRRVRAYRIGLT